VLYRIARLAIRSPRRILAIAALVAVVTAVFGTPVADHLSSGGFQDPGSESARAARLLGEKFGQSDQQLLITLTSPAGATSGAAQTVGAEIVARLDASPDVLTVTSPWTSPPAAAAELISTDGKTGLVVATMAGGENNAQTYAAALAEQVVGDRGAGMTVRAGGTSMIYKQINQQTTRDLTRMEAIAVPLSFLVLVWVFGGVAAALLPLLVGMMAILGAMAVLRLITTFSEVSIFALNITSALGLALAIDYTLLIASRYRDEIGSGATPHDALIRTMCTAGRTVLFSAMTVALSLSALMAFPMYFLKSFAYAGVATVAFAAAAAVIVTPAAIAMLGPRLESLDLRRRLRRILHRPEPVAKPVDRLFWYRSTKVVMRRAIPVGASIVALLVLLAPTTGCCRPPPPRVRSATCSARTSPATSIPA
jgi:RND superfamily putative drug exporter